MKTIDRRSRHRGLTLIELLAVLFIISLLAGLLLVGVQASREASRRAVCQSHLRQIGLALNSFAGVHESLPAANSGSMLSFYVPILPHLEQAGLYNTINFEIDEPGVIRENDTASRVSLGVLLCPSDPPPLETVAWTSYAGNRGFCDRDPKTRHLRYDGVFGLRGLTLRQIKDGLSQTAAVSEWLVGIPDLKSRDERRTVFKTPRKSGEPETPDELFKACQALDIQTAGFHGNDKGMFWILGEYCHTLYNHTLPINERSCSSGIGGVQRGGYSAGSQHFSGANILFADGHVAYLSNKLAISVWRAIGSSAGGEIIEDPF